MEDNAKEEIIITNKNKLEVSHKCGHALYEYYKYKVPKAFSNSKLQIAVYEIPPKKSGYPYHYHLRNEEVFYIVRGIGLLKSEELEREVSEGDIIVCPPFEGGAHMLTNKSDSDTLTYIEVDVSYYPEVIVYPNSNKIGILEDEKMKHFYNKSTEVDYYESE